MASDFDVWLSASTATDVLAMGQASWPAIEAVRAQRLARLLAHARRHTRLHEQRLRGIADGAALHTLPVLDKDEWMARFDDSVADPALRRSAVLDFIADPAHVGMPLLGRYLVWESSGTSGTPGLYVQDPASMAVYDALEACRPQPRGLPYGLPGLGSRIAFVGATGGHFASQVSVQRLRRLNPWMSLALRSFSILQPLPELLAALERWAPVALATYPTAAALLADEQQRGALRLSLSQVMTGGETLDAAQRAHVESTFGCRVRNSYGASEFLAMASECAAGRLHLNADWVILEPVDRLLRPLPPGELSHTTLLTNLANRVHPLIRVDIGDRVRLGGERCTCGSQLPVIEVQGRHDDVLALRGARGRMVSLLPLALCTVLEDEAGVFDFQLRQTDAHTLAIRLGARDAPTPEAAAARFACCHEVLQRFARAQGVADLRLVDEPGLAPQAGRSGKVRRVIGV